MQANVSLPMIGWYRNWKKYTVPLFDEKVVPFFQSFRCVLRNVQPNKVTE